MSGGKIDRWDEIYYVIKNSNAKSVASRVVEGIITDDGKEVTKTTFYNKANWEKGAKKISAKKFRNIVKGEYKSRNPITNSKEKDFKGVEKKFKPATRKYLNKYLGTPSKRKVVKIGRKYIDLNGAYKSYMVIQGLDKNNDVVWKYKTPAQVNTEITTTMCKIHGKSVYVMNTNGYFIRLNKSNGKVQYYKKLKVLRGATDLVVDRYGNCFVSAYYGNFLVKITKNGKIIWHRSFNKYKEELCWPYAPKLLSGGKIVLYFEQFDYSKHPLANGYKMILNQKTGKILSGKYF